MRREKQELHTQFAREIEAAHAQLSQRETELGAEHLNSLQQLKDEHNKGIEIYFGCNSCFVIGSEKSKGQLPLG